MIEPLLYLADHKFYLVKKYILDQASVSRKLERMALEIAESNTDANHIILAGIQENGSVIAAKLLPMLQKECSAQVDLISLSFDKKQPKTVSIEPMITFDNKVVIIIDDVANSGKAMTYALKPFLEAYPQKIQTLVLVERTHKAFPVRADYVGLSVATTLLEHIFVETDGDEITGAYLL